MGFRIPLNLTPLYVKFMFGVWLVEFSMYLINTTDKPDELVHKSRRVIVSKKKKSQCTWKKKEDLELV